jgi:hypothetical protein
MEERLNSLNRIMQIATVCLPTDAGRFLGKEKSQKEKKLKGDKLRELIFLVHLNNKYGKERNEIPALKEILGYSTGGIYNALDSSGYFERTVDGIRLTKQGKEYLNREILTPFKISNSVGDVLIFVGLVFLFQWIEWTYAHSSLIFPVWSALVAIAGGVFIRFFLLRLNYWFIKKSKRMV